MNPTTLIDETYGSIAATDISSSAKYKTLFNLISSVRSALLGNANLRAPYVEVLCSLYEGFSRRSREVKSIRPVEPTDTDIRRHVREDFPAVVLAEPPESESDDPFIRGFTWVGIECVDDKKIYLNVDVVNLWLGKSQKKGTITSPKLTLIIAATLFHKFAHHLMLWWFKGHRRITPTIEPVLTKAGGNLVEQRIFGGALNGWWKETEIGNFAKVREIGVVSSSVPRIFDGKTVAECMAKIGKQDATLPFINIERLPHGELKTCQLVHAKFNGADPNEIKKIKQHQFEPYRDGSQDDAGPGVGLGLVGVPLLRNDTFVVISGLPPLPPQ